MNSKLNKSIGRRAFLGLTVAGATIMLAGCDGSQDSASSNSTSSTTAAPPDGEATALSGRHLTFVGDDAFAPYRSPIAISRCSRTAPRGSWVSTLP